MRFQLDSLNCSGTGWKAQAEQVGENLTNIENNMQHKTKLRQQNLCHTVLNTCCLKCVFASWQTNTMGIQAPRKGKREGENTAKVNGLDTPLSYEPQSSRNVQSKVMLSKGSMQHNRCCKSGLMISFNWDSGTANRKQKSWEKKGQED